MKNQRERDEFIAILTQELPAAPVHHVVSLASSLMRASTTLHRLAEAQCNGDWPADNGDRKVIECSRCGAFWVRSSMVKDRTAPKVNGGAYVPLICQDCRTSERVTAQLEPFGIKPVFQGDPRGCVFKLKMPSGRTNDCGREGICVP